MRIITMLTQLPIEIVSGSGGNFMNMKNGKNIIFPTCISIARYLDPNSISRLSSTCKTLLNEKEKMLRELPTYRDTKNRERWYTPEPHLIPLTDDDRFIILASNIVKSIENDGYELVNKIKKSINSGNICNCGNNCHKIPYGINVNHIQVIYIEILRQIRKWISDGNALNSFKFDKLGVVCTIDNCHYMAATCNSQFKV